MVSIGRVEGMNRSQWERSLLPCHETLGWWLCGFTDGEGCFSISPTAKKGYVCSFTIKLRADDAPVLDDLRHEFDIGTVTRGIHSSQGNGKPWAAWKVGDKAGLLLLTEVFDAFPLRSRKSDIYGIWREAVIHWANSDRPVDWTPIAEAHARLRVLREYVEAVAS